MSDKKSINLLQYYLMHLSDFIFFTVTLTVFAILTLMATWDHVGKYSNWEENTHCCPYRLSKTKFVNNQYFQN